MIKDNKERVRGCGKKYFMPKNLSKTYIEEHYYGKDHCRKDF